MWRVPVLALLVNPTSGWTHIHGCDMSVARVLALHTIPFALCPAIAGYWGTTEVGWEIGRSGLVRLTAESAFIASLIYFLAIVVAALTVAWAVHWMSGTYGAHQSRGQCLALASYSATPLFLVGLVHLNPIIWLNFVAGIPALGFTVYLFYTGVPIMMEVARERAFLYASAVMAFGLVSLVGLLAAMVLMWGAGLAPQLTR